MKILSGLKPIMYIFPEVESSDRKLPFRDKLVWTGISLLIFLVLSHLPLYGISGTSWDLFYQQRLMLASNRGTIMELGISPVLFAGLLIQLLSGAKIIDVNQSIKEDRMLVAGAQKLLCVFLALVQASVYVLSGTYTIPSELGYLKGFLIIFQLVGTSYIVLLLDQLVQRGYGIGSGISLFVCTTICGDLIWKCLAPVMAASVRGPEYTGVLVALPHLLWTKAGYLGKAQALFDGFFRSSLPNIWGMLIVVAVALAVVFLQSWRVDVLIKYQKQRAQQGNYPIKLFYTSNMPIVILSALVASIYFFSQVLYSAFPLNPFVILLGVWQPLDYNTDIRVPISGVAYYISPPANVIALFGDLFHTIFYVLFTLTACALFSKMWIEVSGSNPRGIAKYLREQSMVIKGHRDTALEHELSRYIPTAAAFGGVVVGGLAVLTELLGSVGSGMGVLMVVTTIYQYYEVLTREYGVLPLPAE